MKYRSHKIILMVTAGILLSFSVASAKNFTIFNALNANQPYFSVNGTSGNVGIGITNPATLLQILNNGWISAKNNAGTGVVNMFKVNAFDQIEVGAPLNIGSFEFSPDSGLVTFVDMPVTAAAASGTIESYVFKLDGDNMLSIYAESNGVGGIKNKRVGIGRTNPSVELDVIGSGYFSGTVGGTGLCIGADCKTSWNDIVIGGGGNLWAGTTTSAIYSNNGAFNVGIGTSVPLSKLQIGEQTSLSTATPITLSLGGTYSSVAGTSSKLKLYDSAGSIYGLGVSSNQFDFMIPTGARYSWNINGAEKMRLDTNGNLGIGTTTPIAKLHTYGNGTLAALFTNGNVGIGKTDPGFMLDVNSSFRAGLASISSLSPGGIVMADASGLLYATSTAVATGLPSPVGISGQTLRSDGTSWLANSFLFNTGTNIGIGLTLPAQKLDISGALKLANATVTATDTTIGNRYLCDATTTGTFRYDATSGQSYLCDGIRWLNQENCGVMTDDEGHTYGTVQIGGQCFMAENINIGTMLGAGTTEPTTTDNIIQKWCYNNLESNCVLYGGLYNWNEAMRGASFSGARGICPSGWHIPTDVEYNNLEKTVQGIINSPNAQYPCDFSVAGWRRCADNNGADSGGTYGAGKSLKGVGIGSGNGLGNDLVGFNGKLTGYRGTNGTYYGLGTHLTLWSSTPSGASNAWHRYLYTSYSTVYRYTNARAYGFSVRCLRD